VYASAPRETELQAQTWRWGYKDDLLALASLLEGRERDGVVADVPAEPEAIDNEYAKGRTLAALTRLASRESLPGIEARIWAITAPDVRWEALAALAPRLLRDQRNSALTAALDAIEVMETPGLEGSRVRALAAILPELSAETRSRAFAHAIREARLIQTPADRAAGLASVVSYASSRHVRELLAAEAFAATRAVQRDSLFSDESRSTALAAIASYLPDTLLTSRSAWRKTSVTLRKGPRD
jgi:hypothetical protein